MDKCMQKRFNLLMGVLTSIIIVWSAYLFTVQIADPFNFEKERRERYTPSKEVFIPERGAIFDRNHELLVRTVKYYQIDYDRSVLTEETRLEDVVTIAGIMSENSSLSYDYVLRQLTQQPMNRSVFISHRIRESEYMAIEVELRKRQEDYLKGLIANFSMQERAYPKDNIAARLLGAVQENRDSGNASSVLSQLEGITGIERAYDSELKGVYGWKKTILDAWNKPVFIPNLGKQNVKDGYDIVLTIDLRIQQILEMNLTEGLEKFSASNAVGIIMNPKTGEIIAMASISADDKNTRPIHIRSRPNFAASFLFEPGSTIKPFTALAALEKKLFNPDDIIDCRTYRLPGRVIRDSHPFNDLTFQDVIVHSSNVGTSKIAEKLGSESLYNSLTSLGFGTRTGSDLSGESAGLLRKLRDWQGFSLHSISFGQEISVTPLQLVSAYATLANNGVVMRPYVVKEVIDENKKIISSNKPTRIRRVSNKQSLGTMHSILQDVVDNGTAKGTKLPYITIAGKTGTAEKQLPGQVGYARNKYVSNFAGYFPVEDPQMVCLIIYDEPAYFYHYASMSAVVTFRQVTEQILSLPGCDIMTTARTRDKSFIAIPDVTGMSLDEAETKLKQQGILYQVIRPDGRSPVMNQGTVSRQTGTTEKLFVVNQYPKSGVEIESSNQVMIVADLSSTRTANDRDEEIVREMPSLVGLTLRKAVQQAKQSNVRLVINGKGIVREQSISPGKSISYGDECIVKAN